MVSTVIKPRERMCICCSQPFMAARRINICDTCFPKIYCGSRLSEEEYMEREIVRRQKASETLRRKHANKASSSSPA